WRIFVNAVVARVRNRHNHQRLDQILANQTLRRFVYTPFDAGERSRSVENVLAVLQIQNRMTLPRKTRVTARQPDQNITPIAKNLRGKFAVSPDVSGESVFGH